jgi:hypothetical protein
MPPARRPTLRRKVACSAARVLAAVALPAAAHAQALAPKRVLTLPSAPQCAGAALPGGVRDAAGARAEATRARELALNGERAAARAAFARASQLDPSDPQLAYDLARASEEEGDVPGTTAALCRYLLIAPSGREAPEVRTRLARIAPTVPDARDASARAAFARGVEALDARRFDVAVAAFDAVLRQVPSAPEAAYDRGLARLGRGEDATAAADLATYVASPAAGSDRALVLRAVEALRQPRWSPGGAFGRGLVVPGFGQFYTGRPVLGLVVLAGAATGVGSAFVERSITEDRQFTDPFGNPYTTPVTRVERPYRTIGLVAGGAVALVGAAEAAYFAASHRRDRPRLVLRTATMRLPGPDGVRVTAPGLRVSTIF